MLEIRNAYQIRVIFEIFNIGAALFIKLQLRCHDSATQSPTDIKIRAELITIGITFTV
jgi:hypothetical protein